MRKAYDQLSVQQAEDYVVPKVWPQPRERRNRDAGRKGSAVTTALSSAQKDGRAHPALLLYTVHLPDFSYKELRYFCDRHHAWRNKLQGSALGSQPQAQCKEHRPSGERARVWIYSLPPPPPGRNHPQPETPNSEVGIHLPPLPTHGRHLTDTPGPL